MRSTEALAERDRKRDAALFLQAAKECDEDVLVIEALVRISDARKSGEWEPELEVK